MQPTPQSLPPILARIEWCESKNNPLAKNPNSSASGLFQFLKGTWNFYGKKLWGDDLVNRDIFDANDSIELAKYAYSLNGTSDWQASKDCWN